MSELIIYEMHLRGFTRHESSQVQNGGTWKGLQEKIDYLKKLGVNAIELLPILEFDETDCPFFNLKGQRLSNYWGYSPLSFFAPMLRYASTFEPKKARRECKETIRALHHAGIEVILDLVFNHTQEGNEQGPIVSWKGFSERDYYLQNGFGFLNFSGCGNTVNCNNPVVQDLIINALRHFVIEYHVDGFRFDLASIFLRGRQGQPLAEPPLLERITDDPILKNCKLIAEPWDAAGLHQVGSFSTSVYRGQIRWMEWNDDWRNTVRRFLKGESGMSGRFATKLAGSQDIYSSGSPCNSINFITCHDGFTLNDLVTYDTKHNEDNGEENHDGIDINDSWNCGVEGASTKPEVLKLRERQQKNFLLALFLSQGIPMLTMGDEYGHTKNGNNNSYGHDSPLNWFLWDTLAERNNLFHFVQGLIALRKECSLVRHNHFLTDQDVTWHGTHPSKPDWSAPNHLVAFTLQNDTDQLFVAFHAGLTDLRLTLPEPPLGKEWCIVCDSAASRAKDFIEADVRARVKNPHITMIPFSALVLRARDKKS
jgi:isoamylase/glycogen operon protein